MSFLPNDFKSCRRGLENVAPDVVITSLKITALRAGLRFLTPKNSWLSDTLCDVDLYIYIYMCLCICIYI